MQLGSLDLVNRFLFPTPSSSYGVDDFPEELIWVPKNLDPTTCTPEDCIPCLLVPSPFARFLLFYVHSNAEDLGRIHVFLRLLCTQFQVHVLAFEFPGYGICPGGQATEESVTENAHAVFRFIREVLCWPLDGIFVMGRSVGCGPALAVAAENKVHGVILIAPFLSVKDLVKSAVGPLAHMFHDRFINKDLVHKIRSPLLVVHGMKDRLIPVQHGQKIYESCRSRKLLITPPQMEHNSNLHVDPHYFVLPMLAFFSLPDYCFEELSVPSWAYDKRLCFLHAADTIGSLQQKHSSAPLIIAGTKPFVLSRPVARPCPVTSEQPTSPQQEIERRLAQEDIVNLEPEPSEQHERIELDGKSDAAVDANHWLPPPSSHIEEAAPQAVTKFHTMEPCLKAGHDSDSTVSTGADAPDDDVLEAPCEGTRIRIPDAQKLPPTLLDSFALQTQLRREFCGVLAANGDTEGVQQLPTVREVSCDDIPCPFLADNIDARSVHRDMCGVVADHSDTEGVRQLPTVIEVSCDDIPRPFLADNIDASDVHREMCGVVADHSDAEGVPQLPLVRESSCDDILCPVLADNIDARGVHREMCGVVADNRDAEGVCQIPPVRKISCDDIPCPLLADNIDATGVHQFPPVAVVCDDKITEDVAHHEQNLDRLHTEAPTNDTSCKDNDSSCLNAASGPDIPDFLPVFIFEGTRDNVPQTQKAFPAWPPLGTSQQDSTHKPQRSSFTVVCL